MSKQQALWTMFGLSIVITIIQMILIGLVLSQLWTWFITSVFNVPTLSVGQSIGIALVISFLTHKPDLTEGDDGRKFVKMATDAIMTPIISLIIGFIVHMLVQS